MVSQKSPKIKTWFLFTNLPLTQQAYTIQFDPHIKWIILIYIFDRIYLLIWEGV